VPIPDKHISHRLEDIHETCGNILMYLAAAHALAVLAHHFFQRDDTLKRRLPPARDSG
jgi:cytochrome b561